MSPLNWVLQNIRINVTIKLGPSKHQDECHHKIKWKNEKGIKILGIKLFPDNLETTNKNWSKRMAELRDFIEKIQTRKLSLRGKILLLNAKAMAKFWYLATVIPMPNCFLKPTEKLLFEFIWSGSKDPIKREIIYLPIECGGLGLLNPAIQQRAKLSSNRSAHGSALMGDLSCGTGATTHFYHHDKRQTLTLVWKGKK